MSEVPLYGIAYRSVYGLSTKGLFKKCMCGPLCGMAALGYRDTSLIRSCPHPRTTVGP